MTTVIEVKGTWEKQKQMLKEKFASLTDRDLFISEGRKDWMLDILQIKLGKTNAEWQKVMNELELA
jgi:hypothetical protein